MSINYSFFIGMMFVFCGLSLSADAESRQSDNIELKLVAGNNFHVGLISEIRSLTGPAAYGLRRLEEEVIRKGYNVIRSKDSHVKGGSDFYIIAGLPKKGSLVVSLIDKLKLEVPKEKESLLIQNTKYKGKPALLVCGGDETGLMYATLDLATRISWSKDLLNPFQFVFDIIEKPEVKERAVSAVTVQRRYFEERLHDTQYWQRYFDMMAENRLNQFVLIFGYKNNQYTEPNYTAPIYPSFFDVEEFPYVKLSGLSKEQQKKNAESLRKTISLAHERGIEFGVALWDQIERDKKYTSMVRDDIPLPADLPENIIWGLTPNNLIPYTKLAIQKFVQAFPGIDLIQFRMHWESGIQGEVALKFWKEIFIVLKEENPDIKVEARAKDVPDETLYDGVETGLDFKVVTKHWMEQMGMPFHPTHINKEDQDNRRHGYADLLRFPKRYGFKWRLWNGGTTRVLLWGDPNWVKMFAESSHLYDAAGYEFNEPLYFKMNGSLHDAEVSEVLNPEYRYCDYEFERYWHFFQVFGRVGYNPETPSDIWEMEFKERFGNEAGLHLMKGLHLGSKVLPRIVAASYLYTRFASPSGWAELQRMGSLPDFAENSVPSDIQQFASPKEEAELILNGGISPKRLPSQTSEWFLNTSEDILDHVEKAEMVAGDKRNKEFISTTTDLKMLAYLSLYHSKRLLSAVSYNLYTKTKDVTLLKRAIDFESLAVEAYGKLVESAGNMYNPQLDFGSQTALFPGHWRIEHKRLQDELKKLHTDYEKTLATGDKNIKSTVLVDTLFLQHPSDNTEPPKASMDREQKACLGEDLKIAVQVSDASGIESVNLRYRHVSQFEDYQRMEMKTKSGSDVYEAIIPKEFVSEEYDLMYFIEVTDKNRKTCMLPDMELEIPYVIIKTDRTLPKSMERL